MTQINEDLSYEDLQAAASFYDRTINREINMSLDEILHSELDKHLQHLRDNGVPLSLIELNLTANYDLPDNVTGRIETVSEILEDDAHNYFLEDRHEHKDLSNFEGKYLHIYTKSF